MASLSQIKKIHILKNKLSLSEETYREVLSGYNVKSSKELSFLEAKNLLEVLEKDAIALGVWVKMPTKYNKIIRDEKMASSAQLRMIEGIWRDICYFDNDKFAKSSLRKFLKSKFKTDDIMFLTKAKATKVIQAIMAIKKNLKKSVATLN